MTMARSISLLPVALLATSLHLDAARADAASSPATQQACLEAYDSGQRERQAGHLRAARDRFRTCADAGCPSVVRGDCTTWLAEAEGDLPTLAVSVRDANGQDVPGARVLLDGEPLAFAIDGEPAEVDPGLHTLHCELDGYPPVERTVVVQRGEKNRAIVVTLEQAPAAPPAPGEARPSADRMLPYALGGVGAAALVAFAYLGLSGRGDVATMRDTCAPRCAQDRVDAAHGKLVAADVSLVVALGSFGAATWFYVHPIGHTRATGAIGVGPSASGASLQMGVSF